VSAKTAKRISPTDLRRHKRMLGLVAEADLLAAQINMLAQQRMKKLGAFEEWCRELHERYGLALDGSEGVGADGAIARAASQRPRP
jgi:hypothetical protein